jgi:hypothetical protein
MLTALSEFIDFLYTRAVTEMAAPPAGIQISWDIRLVPPYANVGPMVTLNAYLHSERAMWNGKHGRTINCTCNFDSVERGHRVGPEELGIVTDYYIRKFNSKLQEAWS